MQINAGKLTSAFDAIGNMKDLITKGFKALKDEAKKKLLQLFNVVEGEVFAAIGKLAGEAKKAFEDVKEVIANKAKAIMEYSMMKLKDLEKDLTQAMSNLKDVAEAFLQDSVVGPLKENYAKLEDLGKSVLKAGGEILEDVGDFGKAVLDGAAELGAKAVDKTVEIAVDIGRGTMKAVDAVGDFGVDVAKGTVKIAGQAVDETVKFAGKAVDVVADTAESVYNFVKFW